MRSDLSSGACGFVQAGDAADRMEAPGNYNKLQSGEETDFTLCFEPQIFIDKDVATLLWNDVSAAAILLRGGLTC